ncbi:MBL fold metallo-hydrolase [Chloroflexota bacterium]
MKIKWLGHSSFLITAADGTRIVTDPYDVGMGLSYGEIKEAADIVTVGHKHPDHDNVAVVKGKPQVVEATGSQKVKGIDFKGIATYHDTSEGSERGQNTVFCFMVDGISVCHLSDLGHRFSDKQLAELGDVDVILVPVGGFYTIDAATASDVCDQVKPRVVIPMHYKTDKCAYPIAGVEDFLKGKTKVKMMDSSEVELKKGQLPKATEIIVLKNAL